MIGGGTWRRDQETLGRGMCLLASDMYRIVVASIVGLTLFQDDPFPNSDIPASYSESDFITTDN